MLSSTGEVKDAVRLAQQYNIHIYKYLINGLGNSSQKSAQLKVELDVYTRSSMKLFDRLYQIRDSKIPSMRVREEQINVFREEVKRNEKLVQEVHNIQRALWNQRAMGQKIPLANKSLILQAFPELCVSTRPDNVPLTVLCEQIIHKYSLHNDRERCVMDMLRWADEERMARRRSNQALPRLCQNNTGRLVTKPLKKENKPATDSIVVNDVTPVQSWDDLSEEVIQPVISGKTEGHNTLTTTTDVIHNTKTDTNQGTQQPVVISLEASKQGNNVVSELMAALKDIPELDALLDTPVTKTNHNTVNQPELNHKSELNHNNGHLQKPDALTQTVTNTSSIKMDTTTNKSEDSHLDCKENIQQAYIPRGKQTLSWDEIMKRFSKPAEPQKVSDKISQPEHITKSSHQVQKSSENSESNALNATTELSSAEIILSHKEPDQTTQVYSVTSDAPKLDTVENQTLESLAETVVAGVKNETQNTLVKVQPIKRLVGTDRPHVYENIMKKRKQHGPTKIINSMTSAEVDEFRKKREEALRQLELKKQRTKTILNNQYDKSFSAKSSVHYFKVQSLPKIDNKFSQNTSSVEPSKYRKPTAQVLNYTNKGVISTSHTKDITSRKRPASSVNSVSCMPAPKRPRRPRIILKIFRDDDDWNVEQVIDRD